MPNDEKVQAEIAKATFEHLQKIMLGEKTGDAILKFVGIAVHFTDNEDEQDVVLCEDDGESTVIRVREPGVDGYCIMPLAEEWANDEWWENNSFVLPEDVALAVVYYYLREMNVPLQNKFNSRYEAKLKVYKALKGLDTKDEFAENLLSLFV